MSRYRLPAVDLIRDIEMLNCIIHDYYVKSTFTNNYVLSDAYLRHIADKTIFYVATTSNACILVRKNKYYQLYYYVNNLDEFVTFNPDHPVMMEILYRGETQRPKETIAYWEKCGFRQHLTRDLMMSQYANLRFPSGDDLKIEIKYSENEQEAIYTKELIEQTFDKYTGDILTIGEIKTFADKKNILCAYMEGKLCGILQYELKNNVVWLGHIAVSSEFRGYGIANALVTKYIADNAIGQETRYQLWVIKDNAPAISLYQKFGFVYGNKSSASMLRD